jgi:hypothetical protein
MCRNVLTFVKSELRLSSIPVVYQPVNYFIQESLMKNLVLTFLLALLVVLTAISVRRMVAGTATTAAKSPALVAIGADPVPLPPPPKPQPAVKPAS